jgi:pilus assembly protein FimV
MVAGALFLPGSGYTLGLGEIEVNSALNQKFNADIELLSATPEDTESIIIKLASRKEFARAGLDRPYLLNDLRFKAETINGSPHIKVTSGSPVREPFLNFLVEIDWPNGHLLREYTVLLDPPVFMTQSAARPAAAAPAALKSPPAS